MLTKQTLYLVIIFLLSHFNWVSSQDFIDYHPLDKQGIFLQNLAKKHPSNTELTVLTESPGNNKVYLLKIISNTKQEKPAIFVLANPEGNTPIATEAALHLAASILNNPDNYKNYNWYLIANGNPDASTRYFSALKVNNPRNYSPFNDDMDDQTDEDPFDDLDKNGIITQMRVKDIDGGWLIDESDARLMRKADKEKGERGQFKIYTEGIDNDNDGKYNEDTKGGTNVGINFPHLHKPFTSAGGMWPGSSGEAYAIMKFVNEQADIAMTMVYGSTNFCIKTPVSGRNGKIDFNRIRLDKSQAKMLGVEADKRYSMKEIIVLAEKIVPPGVQVTEALVATHLGLGSIVNPLKQDLQFYSKLNGEFKAFLEDKGFKINRLDPEKSKNGSFELWSYYELGLPSFSMDFWALPNIKSSKTENKLSIDSLAKLSKEQILQLNENSLDSLIKAVGADQKLNAKKIKSKLTNDKLEPKALSKMLKKFVSKKDKKQQALMAYIDQGNAKAFIEWKTYKHPQLGEVEIGGPVPFAENTPPASALDSLLKIQVPWIFELTKKLPQLKIADTKVKAKGNGLFQVELWVENTGLIAFPTAMGAKNKHGQPAVIEVIGKVNILSGKKRVPVQQVKGNGLAKYQWLMEAKTNTQIEFKLSSSNAGNDSKMIKLGGI